MFGDGEWKIKQEGGIESIGACNFYEIKRCPYQKSDIQMPKRRWASWPFSYMGDDNSRKKKEPLIGQLSGLVQRGKCKTDDVSEMRYTRVRGDRRWRAWVQ